MAFRTDINGLRAIAVLLVVFFHFGVPGANGGFVGVDVFFVISGFLMTGIIFSNVRKGTFSLFGFYLDRIRRIVPALVFLCLFMLIVGWFLLLPSEYQKLGTHTASSLAFISNIVFWKESGYFEQVSQDKWLLHTWSLSIEWQFYVFYPLFILYLKRILPTEKSRWIILAAALISFMLSILASSRWPTSAFYLLPTRAWELLTGALVYLLPIQSSNRTGSILKLSGLALIAFSALYFSEETTWPGLFTTIPVLGAALVIAAPNSQSWLLGNRVCQFIGNTSYSIYLWHWPLFAWIYYFGLADDTAWVTAAISTSILLGYLSYSFIERPARPSANTRSARRPPFMACSASIFVMLLGAIIFYSHGFTHRMSEEFKAATKELVMPSKNNGWCFYDVEKTAELPINGDGLKCTLGDRRSSFKGILFGDSFAGHYGPFWDQIGKNTALQVNAVSTNWCYPSITQEFTGTIGRAYRQCLINRKYLTKNIAQFDFAIFAGSWGSVYRQNKMKGVYDAISLAAENTKLVVIMPAPTTFDVNVKNMYERSLLFGIDFDIDQFGRERDSAAREANKRLEQFSKQHPNVLFLRREALFNINGVPSDVTRDNIPYNLDEHGHISLYGSKMAAYSFMNSDSYPLLKERLFKARKGRPAKISSQLNGGI